jgi:hypothetical protein
MWVGDGKKPQDSLIERIESLFSENSLLTAMLRGLRRSELTEGEYELIRETFEELERRMMSNRQRTAYNRRKD